MQHAVRLDSSATQQCVHLIVTATAHHDKAVRQAACSVAAACVKQALSLSGDFIAALQQLLRIAPDIPVSPFACGSSQCNSMLHMSILSVEGSAGLHAHRCPALLYRPRLPQEVLQRRKVSLQSRYPIGCRHVCIAWHLLQRVVPRLWALKLLPDFCWRLNTPAPQWRERAQTLSGAPHIHPCCLPGSVSVVASP